MKILAIESDQGAASSAIAELQAAGHTVVRCQEPGAPAFPCKALTEHDCPLDVDVDVMLDVRAHPHVHPTPMEHGVTCGLRHHVPLVVTGAAARHPFEDFEHLVANPERPLEEACAQAAGADVKVLVEAAETAANKMLFHMGGQGPAHASVQRNGRRFSVVMHLQPEDRDVYGERVAVAALSAIDKVAPHAEGVDVAIALRNHA